MSWSYVTWYWSFHKHSHSYFLLEHFHNAENNSNSTIKGINKHVSGPQFLHPGTNFPFSVNTYFHVFLKSCIYISREFHSPWTNYQVGAPVDWFMAFFSPLVSIKWSSLSNKHLRKTQNSHIHSDNLCFFPTTTILDSGLNCFTLKLLTKQITLLPPCLQSHFTWLPYWQKALQTFLPYYCSQIKILNDLPFLSNQNSPVWHSN